MEVWINGRFVPREDARISVFDAGFQHAVGLFETMQARHGRVFRLLEHLERLEQSATMLRLMSTIRVGPLADAVRLTVERNNLQAARVRLTMTGGDLGSTGAAGAARVDPTIVIAAQPPTPYPVQLFEKGVKVTISDGRLNPLDPLAGHKALNYWARIMALQQAAAAGAGEALWFTVTNHLASGCVSNIVLVRNEELWMPIVRGEEESGALPAAVLPGITRAAIIQLADREGLTVHRRMLDIESLLAAEEVFLTNSSWGVLPVTSVEQNVIGDGNVGPMTKRLRDALEQTIDLETSTDGAFFDPSSN
jgi:branched-chain amino acid aminotransferase